MLLKPVAYAPAVAAKAGRKINDLQSVSAPVKQFLSQCPLSTVQIRICGQSGVDIVA